MSDACVCIDVDDPPEATWEYHPVARKEHKCGECGDAIQVGKIYEKIVLLFEGAFSTHRTCDICVKIRTEHFQCGWYFGNIYEDLAELWGTTKELLLTGKDSKAAPDKDAKEKS